MHVFASGTIGFLVAIGCIVYAADHVLAILYSPLIVSGTVLALGMLPARRA